MLGTKDLRFKYDGNWRHVSNVTFEDETKTLIGFEMRKAGKFSYRIKRYSFEKISDVSFVKPFLRNGPRIGYPQ